MSKIITVWDHNITIPEPKDKKDILFHGMKDPYWVRDLAVRDYNDHNGIWYDYQPGKGGTRLYEEKTWYDDNGNLVSLNKDDSDWIIRMYEREWHRREFGVHFMNGDEVTYLTGDHWFVLAWCKTKRPDKISDYFDYREFQAWFYYLIMHTNASDWIDGCDFSKAKKTGITNLMWLYYLNKATRTKNLNLGNMNIDQQKGAKTFRDHFMYAFNNLPLPLKPGIKAKSENDGSITFGERATNSKRNSRSRHSEDELNTTVMCVPTILNAFDVDIFSDTWYDEPPKYKSDFGEIYRSNSEGTKIQDISAGKKWLTSYNPEGDAPSFLSAKKIFYDSELSTINYEVDSKKTKTGMICVHIPAYQSWSSSFNKYGKCDEKDAMKKIMARRDALKSNPRELLVETRRYANNKRESWTTGGSGSVFDIARLSEILLAIEEKQRYSIDTPYKEGKLEWTNVMWEVGLKNKRPNGEFCPVKFVPITKEEIRRGQTGRLRIYNDIADVQKNAVLKNGKDEYGCLNPPQVFRSFLGGDPTQHAAASEVIEGSKNGYICVSAVDHVYDAMMGRIASGTITFEYFDRPELPREAYEDLVKLIIYTGSLATVEANVPEFATKLIEEGLGRFLLVKDKFGFYRIWERWMGLAHEEDKEYHLIRTTSNNQDTRDLLETFVRLIKQVIQMPAEGEKDYGMSIESERLIMQLMNLDITDTKLFDLFMCYGYALFTRDQYSAILLNMQSLNQRPITFNSVMNAMDRRSASINPNSAIKVPIKPLPNNYIFDKSLQKQ